MRAYRFKPIPLFARRDSFAKLWRVCVVTDCSSNSSQRLRPTHHLLIEFLKCTLTPYYHRRRCRMNSPLFSNASRVRETYILVYLSDSRCTARQLSNGLERRERQNLWRSFFLTKRPGMSLQAHHAKAHSAQIAIVSIMTLTTMQIISMTFFLFMIIKNYSHIF